MGTGFTELFLDGGRSERQALPANGDGVPPSLAVREEEQSLHARCCPRARNQQDRRSQETTRPLPLGLELAQLFEDPVANLDVLWRQRLQAAEAEGFDVVAGNDTAVDDGFAHRVMVDGAG